MIDTLLDKPMLLYHYAKEKHPTLLTLEKQGKVTAEEREKEIKDYAGRAKQHLYFRPGYYFEHISFFFEPPPLNIMSKIFPKDHRVWVAGNTLYEHVIDTVHIGHFRYEIVEFPEKTVARNDWSIPDDVYFKLVADAIKANGYIGAGSHELDKAARKFLGTTHDHFRDIPNQPDYKEIKNLYAASVPHVMIYPDTGMIEPDRINKVKVK